MEFVTRIEVDAHRAAACTYTLQAIMQPLAKLLLHGL